MTVSTELKIEVNREELDVLIKDIDAFRTRFVYSLIVGFGSGCLIGVAATFMAGAST